MYNRVTLLSLCFYAIACKVENGSNSAVAAERQALIKKEISPGTLQLEIDSAYAGYSEELEEGLFGKFFGDRAEFFIVKDPENKIYDEKVNMIVLCFIDGQLCQTKYHLDNDITQKLIQKFGRFYITGFDQTNRDILKKEGATEGDSLAPTLNSKLTNYELIWRFNSKDIKFRVNKEDPKSPFQYVERLANYEMLLKKIELSGN